MSSRNEILSASYALATLGVNGVDIIVDTEAHTGEWVLMEIIADTTFANLECSNIYVNDGETAVTESTLPANKAVAGAKLYGLTTAVTLSAGSVALYRK